MTTLLKRIKAELLDARKGKAKEVVNVLNPVIGDLQTAYRKEPRNFEFDDMPDAPVMDIINAHLKGANLTLAQAPGNKEALESVKILTAFKPKQLTEDELGAIIIGFTKEEAYNGLGSLMKFMRAEYTDRYDARMVKEIHDTIA